MIDIESKLAHQEQALIELNAVITKQQETIMTLERLYAAIAERVATLAEAIPDAPPQDERPPHY